jgi:hypothetical protein
MGSIRQSATCAPSATNGGFLGRYLRAIEGPTRGPIGVMLFAATLVAASVVGGRAGLMLASGWLLFVGTWCVGNFVHCRETHCGVTGPGWTLLALVGFAAVLTPGMGLGWYSVRVEVVATLVILALGYGLQWTVAAITGRGTLG